MAREEHFDCLVIGAGISGLDAAYHIQKHASWANYQILERRSNLGGTWDFFKYPGIRSDSDMFTFGFSWKIWRSAEPIATELMVLTPGIAIMSYLKEAAEEQGLMEKIRFNTDIESASFTSEDNKWHLVTKSGARFSCDVLFGCTGYYSYETPYEPKFPGQERFPGPIVHPQKWTEEHDKAIVGKKVAMIGSGATAVTILPSIADSASHVTMVQRTPTYIAAKPKIDPIANFLTTWLPIGFATWLNRWIQVLLGALFYQYCTRDGKATIVTGHIETFTETGIEMKNGENVEADFIISATGLALQKNFPFSTMKVTIDGEEYKAPEHLIYNSIMISDVPNFAFVVGYTNASWTLKADIASLYFAKLLNYMRDNKVAKVVPKEDPKDPVNHEAFDGGLSSGYFARAKDVLPKQGDRHPWKGGVNYIVDLISMSVKSLSKESLEFTLIDKKKS